MTFQNSKTFTNPSYITGKPNIINIWTENSVGLVKRAMTGAVVIDQTAPLAGVVTCPEFIQVYYGSVKSIILSEDFFIISMLGNLHE